MSLAPATIPILGGIAPGGLTEPALRSADERIDLHHRRVIGVDLDDVLDPFRKRALLGEQQPVRGPESVDVGARKFPAFEAHDVEPDQPRPVAGREPYGIMSPTTAVLRPMMACAPMRHNWWTVDSPPRIAKSPTRDVAGDRRVVGKDHAVADDAVQSWAT